MSDSQLSRRQFARVLGTGLGALAVVPGLARGGVQAAGTRPGTGIPAGATVRPEKMPATGEVRIDSNENPYGPSPKAIEAMSRAHAGASRYPDDVEEKVAAVVAKLHGVGVENVILGCGSGEILRIADAAFLGPGKKIVAAEPTFEAVLHYAKVTRAEAVKVPVTSDHRHDLPRMAAACDATTGLVYVCNPNNPTGTIVTRQELGALFERVPKTAMILVDEAYHHFVEDARYASAFEWWGKIPNLLVARTFSKIFGLAGMRLGYGVGSRETIEAILPHRAKNIVNRAVLEAALASLEDPGHVTRCRTALNGTRRWLCAELEKDARAYIPSETNFVMIDVGSDVAPVIAALRERGIFVGRKFPSLPNWLRVSIGTPEEMRRFAAGLREVVPVRASRAA